MSAVQKNIEASSETYSSTFANGDLPLPPAKKYLLLACMDARIDPAAAFGINLGDAHVIRNVSFSLPLSLSPLLLEQGLLEWNELVADENRNIGWRFRSRRPPLHRHQRAAPRHDRDRGGQAHRVWDADFPERGCIRGC